MLTDETIYALATLSGKSAIATFRISGKNTRKVINKISKIKKIETKKPKLIKIFSNKKNNDEKINFILLNKIGKTTMPNKYKISINELKKNIKRFTQY